MASATPVQLREADEGGLTPYKLTVQQFKTMIVAGVFPEDARVELLGGVLAAKMTKNTPHNFALQQLSALLRDLVAGVWVVREEKSVELGRDWRPEPDIAVSVGPPERYRKADPAAADLILIAEVSDTSYATDRGAKWHGYASAKVPAYWVVDLSKRLVEVHTNPSGRGATARYRDVQLYRDGESVPVVVQGRDLGSIALKDILP